MYGHVLYTLDRWRNHVNIYAVGTSVSCINLWTNYIDKMLTFLGGHGGC